MGLGWVRGSSHTFVSEVRLEVGQVGFLEWSASPRRAPTDRLESRRATEPIDRRMRRTSPRRGSAARVDSRSGSTWVSPVPTRKQLDGMKPSAGATFHVKDLNLKLAPYIEFQHVPTRNRVSNPVSSIALRIRAGCTHCETVARRQCTPPKGSERIQPVRYGF